jgi:hypothetical protein
VAAGRTPRENGRVAGLSGRVGLWLLAGFLAVGFLASTGAFDRAPSPSPARVVPVDVDRYVDQVAAQLTEPGALVDPALVTGGALTRDDALALDGRTASAPGDVRLAVLPARPLRLPGGRLAWPPEELLDELERRVGSDGLYALVLRRADGSVEVHASRSGATAPRSDLVAASEEATTCCDGDVVGSVATFLDAAAVEPASPWRSAATGLAWLALLAAAAGAWWWRRRLARRADRDRRVVELLRAPLQEEVGDLSYRAAALPTADRDPADELTGRVLAVHRHVGQAGSRLSGMVTAEDAEAVTRLLAEARYELTAVEAVREGRAVPERTPPCHLDPRHGPSVARSPYTPTGGTERVVPVCAGCRDALAYGQRPHVRRLQRSPGTWALYWDVGDLGAPYVAGYWPDPEDWAAPPAPAAASPVPAGQGAR